MKNIIVILVFLVSTLAMAQTTTVVLEEQCNCQVLSGTAVTAAGMTTPTGADTGDIYVNTNSGTIYFWDGVSWELTATDSQQLQPFTFDNTTGELILTLENGGTSNIFLPLQTLTSLTLNGNSLEYKDENGLTNTIPLNVGNLSLGSDGNSLDFTNEESVTTNIPLNVGALSFDPATRELTYNNELGVAKVITLPTETTTTIAGTSATGNAIGVYENESGDLVTINETITSISDIGDGNVTFMNEAGASVTVSKSDITDLGGGIYRFTNNDGTDIDININGITISDVIAGNLIATIEQADGSSVEIDETVTNITGTSSTGNEIGVYENEDGTTVSIQETVTAISDIGDGNITFTNESGGTTTVAKSKITSNPDGTFTFDNGDGSTVTFDGTDNQNAVQVALSPNIDVDGDLVNETTVQDALTDLANNSSDNQDLTGANLNAGNQLVIGIERGNSATADLSALNETVVAGTGAVTVVDDGSGNYTVNSTDSDEDETNELTLMGTGVPAVTPSNSGVTYVDDAAGQLYIYDGTSWNQVGGNVSPDLDPDPTNELQDLSITADALSLSSDPTAAPIDLSVYRDNTDAQQIGLSGNTITLANGTGADTTVDLTGFINTDEQNLTSATLTGNSLTVAIQNGDPVTVNLTALVNDADFDFTNEIQDLDLTGNILTITNNTGATDIDLSGYINTDAQTIGLLGNTITLANGTGSDTTVDLADFINTDNQDLTSATLTGNNLTVAILNGDPVTVDLTTLVKDADFDITNEIQNLSLTGDILTITNNGSATPIDLASYTNTDTQDLSIDATGKIISLVDGGQVTINADDADSVIGNEYNTAFSVVGSDLRLTDGGGNLDVPLSTLGTDTQDLSIDAAGTTISLVDGGSVTVNVNDADANATNEIQDLSISGNVLSLTGDATTVTLPTPDGTETLVESAVGSELNVAGDGSSATPYVIDNLRPNIFYPPSIVVDASSNGTGRTINLYTQYTAQFATPAVASAGAPAAIPTYAASDLYYYVTEFDTNVFANVSVNTSGVMTYDVIAAPADYNSLINVVFVVK